MTVAAIGENQIARILVIELVDLVAAFEDRHVPFEQIDEHRFARREHRTEHAVRGRTRAELKRVQNVLGSLTVIWPRTGWGGAGRVPGKGEYNRRQISGEVRGPAY